MELKTLIKKIDKELPEAKAMEGIEWDMGYEEAIWFKGSEDYAADGQPIFDIYGNIDTDGVHPKLYKIIDTAGWYCEPYDAGTLFAFKD